MLDDAEKLRKQFDIAKDTFTDENAVVEDDMVTVRLPKNAAVLMLTPGSPLDDNDSKFSIGCILHVKNDLPEDDKEMFKRLSLGLSKFLIMEPETVYRAADLDPDTYVQFKKKFIEEGRLPSFFGTADVVDDETETETPKPIKETKPEAKPVDWSKLDLNKVKPVGSA